MRSSIRLSLFTQHQYFELTAKQQQVAYSWSHLTLKLVSHVHCVALPLRRIMSVTGTQVQCNMQEKNIGAGALQLRRDCS